MMKTIPEVNQYLTDISENIVQDQIDIEYDDYIQSMEYLYAQNELAALSYDADAEFYGNL